MPTHSVPGTFNHFCQINSKVLDKCTDFKILAEKKQFLPKIFIFWKRHASSGVPIVCLVPSQLCCRLPWHTVIYLRCPRLWLLHLITLENLVYPWPSKYHAHEFLCLSTQTLYFVSLLVFLCVYLLGSVLAKSFGLFQSLFHAA